MISVVGLHRMHPMMAQVTGFEPGIVREGG